MKATQVDTAKPDINIRMTHAEAVYLKMICGGVSGPTSNPLRRAADDLYYALKAACVNYDRTDATALIELNLVARAN